MLRANLINLTNNDIYNNYFDIDKLSIKFERYRIKIITTNAFVRENSRIITKIVQVYIIINIVKRFT